MKRKQRASAAAADADADEPTQAPLPLESFYVALTARYGRSAAPQHRHLLASAAAIRSILVDDGLPLTPASYLPAAVSALQAAGPADPAAASALASLLAILLAHIPSSPSPLPPADASESASALAAFLSSPDASKLPTGTVRSVVKSLGHLSLHLDAAGDWGAVAAPLEALLASSVDQRAKVRKCAQESVEKLFAYLEQSGCAKKASNAAVGMFEKHISSAGSHVNLDSDVSEDKEREAVHMLGAMAVLVPYLSKKAMKRVFSDAYQLLSPCFTPITRHVLRLLGVLLDHLKAENVESELESLLSSSQRPPLPSRRPPPPGLANNGLPKKIQKLRCRVNYDALRFTLEIESLGRRLVQILHQKAAFVVLHLRYEMDMLAFSGCTHGCSNEEAEELTRMRYAYPWWKEKVIDSNAKRKDGFCPLTPEETAMVLKALGIDRSYKIYIAAGEIYGGDRRMAALTSAYPNVVRKETLLPSELSLFQNHSSQMAALDYMVSLESDIFIPTYDGNMAKVVEGHRRYLGFKKTVMLDRKLIVELVDQCKNGTLSWSDFSSAVKASHTGRMGEPSRRQVIPDKPKEEDYFYANPHECLHQPDDLSVL